MTSTDLAVRQVVPFRGKPAARTPVELLEMLRTAGLGELVEATGTWLMSGGRTSDNTRTVYARAASWWLFWCEVAGVDPVAPRPIDADQYAAALTAAGLSRSTVAVRLSAASSWYAYLVRADVATLNPFNQMDRPRVDDDSPSRGLSRAEVAQLLAHARRHESPRTYALLAVIYLTAVRLGVALAANTDDLGHDSGHRVLRYVGKGGKRRQKLLTPTAVDALDRWQADRLDPRPDPRSADRSPKPLFTTGTGRRLDAGYVRRLIRRVARAAGIPDPERLSPHSLRHSYATHALDAGHPLHVVQDALDHADPRTTRRYDRARRSLARSPSYALDQALAADMHAVMDPAQTQGNVATE